MKPTFAVGIPHCNWLPERVSYLKSMLDTLGHRYIVGLHTHRVPRWMTTLYSEAVYRWLVAQDVSHCIFMSDDLTICPRFWDIVEAMVEAVPDQAIALDSLHPKGVQVAAEGKHWYRCRAWLAGPCMLWPKAMLLEHMRWLDAQPLGFVRDHGDDGNFNEYLFQMGMDSWHPVPAPVDHDADLPTVQTGIVEKVEKWRRPPVLWHGYDLDKLAKVETWLPNEMPPFFKVPSEEEKDAALLDQR